MVISSLGEKDLMPLIDNLSMDAMANEDGMRFLCAAKNGGIDRGCNIYISDGAESKFVKYKHVDRSYT